MLLVLGRVLRSLFTNARFAAYYYICESTFVCFLFLRGACFRARPNEAAIMSGKRTKNRVSCWPLEWCVRFYLVYFVFLLITFWVPANFMRNTRMRPPDATKLFRVRIRNVLQTPAHRAHRRQSSIAALYSSGCCCWWALEMVHWLGKLPIESGRLDSTAGWTELNGQ